MIWRCPALRPARCHRMSWSWPSSVQAAAPSFCSTCWRRPPAATATSYPRASAPRRWRGSTRSTRATARWSDARPCSGSTSILAGWQTFSKPICRFPRTDSGSDSRRVRARGRRPRPLQATRAPGSGLREPSVQASPPTAHVRWTAAGARRGSRARRQPGDPLAPLLAGRRSRSGIPVRDGRGRARHRCVLARRRSEAVSEGDRRRAAPTFAARDRAALGEAWEQLGEALRPPASLEPAAQSTHRGEALAARRPLAQARLYHRQAEVAEAAAGR